MSDEIGPELRDAFASLGRHDVGAARRELIRRRAHALLGEARNDAPPRSGHVPLRGRGLAQALEPLAAWAFAVVYLAWALARSAALLLHP